MGRPIGSVNREKPFNDALRMALRSRPLALRRVADQLLDKAEQGNLAYIHELIDRLDGKAVQVVDRQDVPIHELTDAELYRIAAGGGSSVETMLLIPPVKVRSDDPI
ncbi:hypothetical protein ABIB94_003202 [Bradyrhizobium sp. JR7.2]|jgi:hypothetical protein|uniref:hypothetical protein n=1 Tax=Bradyrhizobium TaxID=374 RepID=UPI0004BC1284|nr:MULTISPECIES: hypothetical protein [Bradyrhizobium]MBR0883548.1 hypothetical protein [Bradyrhizobium liaoningense]MBR0948384.1 hypothetical protein [Bradyrhizobium liaoningense]MBR1070737.1 hypothetical protein [Bradyrhizobium liaoningense]MCP1776124.1 hypothetical protein [Bradyrhizobium japonicum]MCP1960877.1 hypothetical protein [Bradyrhizobium japonicum]